MQTLLDVSKGLHFTPVKHTSLVYHVQQPAMPRIPNVGDNLIPSNPCQIPVGAYFLKTVQTSEGDSIPSGRMEITSVMPPVFPAHSGISPTHELAIHAASGFSNTSRISFHAIGNPTDMPPISHHCFCPLFQLQCHTSTK